MKKLYYNSKEEELEAAKLVAEKDISENSSNNVSIDLQKDDFGGDY